jgi:divalent metal cation (Fe/Co/Zn/Cd) transporter
VTHAAKVLGVLEVRQARVRVSGPETFADVTLVVSNETTLDNAHQIADQAEGAIGQILPGADVVVHVEPATGEDQDVAKIIRQVAVSHGMSPHGMRIYSLEGNRLLEMHLEVNPSLSVEEAHAEVSTFENDLRRTLPNIHQIVTHIEPIAEVVEELSVSSTDADTVLKILEGLNDQFDMDCEFHQVEVYRVEDQLSVSFHCTVDPETALVDAHARTEMIENELRARLPQVDRVTIHVEPIETNQS